MATIPFINLDHFDDFFTSLVTIETEIVTTSATGQSKKVWAPLAGHFAIRACKWLDKSNETERIEASSNSMGTHTILLKGAFPNVRETMRAKVVPRPTPQNPTPNAAPEIYNIVMCDVDAMGVATTLQVNKVR